MTGAAAAEDDAAKKAAEAARQAEMERQRQKALEEQRLKEEGIAAGAGMNERARFERERIHFDFDKYNLTPEAQKILTRKAEFLRKNGNLKAVIEGHCDERGTAEYNLALGDRRANSAKNYLVNLGISESRLTAISYGEELPSDRRPNEAAWAKNRRCQFLVK